MDVGLPYAQLLDGDEPAVDSHSHEDVRETDDEALRLSMKQSDDPSDDYSDNESDNRSDNNSNSRGSSRSRKRALSDEDSQMHYVAAVQQYHKSWEKLDGYLKTYQQEGTHTILAISETMNVRLRDYERSPT